jgi:galactokinase
MPSSDVIRWRAPGRVNIIGEHIDYLGGTVLPFACDLEVTADVRYRNGPIDLTSPDGDLGPHIDAVLSTIDAQFACEGTLSSAIPVGAGLSSSAALYAVLTLALTRGAPLDPERLRAAERAATGVHGGLMDQMAIVHGRSGQALVLDCATNAFEYVDIADSIAFVVIDTGTRRALSDGRYAQRRTEVEAGEPKRVRHAETEQRRVYDAVDALRAGDAAALGALVSESHRSLRDDFEASSDALDEAVAAAVAMPGCHGARLVGAGFAGCVLAVVDPDLADVLAHSFERAYVVEAMDGAGRAG